MDMKILRIVIAIIVLPLIIIGSMIQIVGRFLNALSYIFWFEPKTFIYKIRSLHEDMKNWIDYK